MASQSNSLDLHCSSQAPNFVGKTLFNAWTYSTNKINSISEFARKKYNEKPDAHTLPLINVITARCYRILPRLLKPFPYASILSIVDFMVTDAVRQTCVEETFPGIALIKDEPWYVDAYAKYRDNFIAKTQSWKIQIIEDKKKAPPKDAQLLDALLTYLDALIGNEINIQIDLILKPYFDEVFSLTRKTLAPQELIDKAQIALGKIMIHPANRSYLDYLISLVELSVRSLIESEQAMRYLGNGRMRDGIDKMYNHTPDAIQMVAIYSVVTELSKAPFTPIAHKGRAEKIRQARTLISPIFSTNSQNDDDDDMLLATSLQILDRIAEDKKSRRKRDTLIVHIDELSEHLFTDDSAMSLSTFTVCISDQTTVNYNLFNQAFADSVSKLGSFPNLK